MNANASMWNEVAPLLVIVRLLQRIADLQDACQAARANCEREQAEHQAYRAAHKGSCTNPGCRLGLPHGHSGSA